MNNSGGRFHTVFDSLVLPYLDERGGFRSVEEAGRAVEAILIEFDGKGHFQELAAETLLKWEDELNSSEEYTRLDLSHIHKVTRPSYTLEEKATILLAIRDYVYVQRDRREESEQLGPPDEIYTFLMLDIERLTDVQLYSLGIKDWLREWIKKFSSKKQPDFEDQDTHPVHQLAEAIWDMIQKAGKWQSAARMSHEANNDFSQAPEAERKQLNQLMDNAGDKLGDAAKLALEKVEGTDEYVRKIKGTGDGQWSTALNRVLSEFHSEMYRQGDGFTKSVGERPYEAFLKCFHEEQRFLRSVDAMALVKSTGQQVHVTPTRTGSPLEYPVEEAAKDLAKTSKTLHENFEQIADFLDESSAQTDPKVKLRPCEVKAYRQYRQAVEVNGECLDDEAYEWVEEHNDNERLPALATWKRYIRKAREAYNQQKNTPRAGRPTGNSIVSSEETEYMGRLSDD